MANYTSSIRFLDNTYTYSFEEDLESGETDERFYLLSLDELFRFMPSDSVLYRTNAIDVENSQISRLAFGFGMKKSVNYGGQVTVPILVGHTGIPLERESFFRHIRMELF
ncbi:MAG: hypothetical protein WD266_08670, partial [Balneolales bacterium]